MKSSGCFMVLKFLKQMVLWFWISFKYLKPSVPWFGRFKKQIAHRARHYNFQSTTRSFLFFFSRDTQEGLIRALNWYPPGITRICFFSLLKKTSGFMRCKRPRARALPNRKRPCKKPWKGLKQKSLEKSLRWKTSFKASKSFKRWWSWSWCQVFCAYSCFISLPQ